MQVNAQIELKQGALAKAGTNYIYSNIEDSTIFNSFSFSKTGINNIWDFSSLPRTFLDTVKYLLPQNTPYNDSFPTAELAVYRKHPGYGLPTYNYYKTESSKLLKVGSHDFHFPITQNFTSNKYSPPVVVFKFPVTYNDSSVSDYITSTPKYIHPSWTVYDSVSYTSFLKEERKVVASGTIKLPSGSYSCVLEKFVITGTDSTYFNDTCGNCPWLSDISGWHYGLYYQWYIANTTQPVAWVDLVYDRLVFSLDTFSKVSINEVAFEEMNVFPNPANNRLNIVINNPHLYNFQITDLSGKILINEKLNTNSIDISALEKGMYFTSLLSENRVVKSYKFIKE